MTHHAFSLVTEGTAALGVDELGRALAAAGYPDAKLRRSAGGDWVVDVHRDADSLRDALLPATEAVTTAGLAVSHIVIDWGS